MNKRELVQFHNCKILRNHKIIKEDLWVRRGVIVNPEKIFFDEKIEADMKIDCKGLTIAPGLIDLQINGGFGHDFSYNIDTLDEGLATVSKNLLAHGVTAFCPTIVTSPKEVYAKICRSVKKRAGGKHGATILGLHLEGPFISPEKKGAHPQAHIKSLKDGVAILHDTYACLDNVKIVTLAPELMNANNVIMALTQGGITVSLGHSTANLAQGQQAVASGATLITHLFNAMLPFHHRDPGLVGLLTSDQLPPGKTVYFGIIADGYHTHPAALRIAHRVHPEGLVLVTDAVAPLGFDEGRYRLGQFDIEVRSGRAYLAGSDTLCGSVTSLLDCVKELRRACGCSVEYALEAASLHPAMAVGMERTKGTLEFGADADFILLDDELRLKSTWIAGERVYCDSGRVEF